MGGKTVLIPPLYILALEIFYYLLIITRTLAKKSLKSTNFSVWCTLIPSLILAALIKHFDSPYLILSPARYTSKNFLKFTFQSFHENMHLQLLDMVNRKLKKMTFENQASFSEDEFNLVQQLSWNVHKKYTKPPWKVLQNFFMLATRTLPSKISIRSLKGLYFCKYNWFERRIK